MADTKQCSHGAPLRLINGEWRCVECETLRDQFAMAAMIADALQPAMIAVSYLAQGKTFTGEYPEMAEGARDYYRTADAMIEARKRC